jgi:hypothetical protein
MNNKIKDFGSFEQGFNPVELSEIINKKFNDRQLVELNIYLTGGDSLEVGIEDIDDTMTVRDTLLFYPNEYLYGLCCNDSTEYPNVGHGGTFDYEWDNIWEHRFEFSDTIHDILDDQEYITKNFKSYYKDGQVDKIMNLIQERTKNER